jgi:hypothetical protein
MGGKGRRAVAQVQEVWNKLNPRERLTAIGALIVALSWIVSLAGYGVSADTISLLGGIAVLAIFYLKYAPNQNITWPAPVPILVLGISAVVALLAAIDVLTSLRYLGLFGFGLGIIALILEAVGAGLMAWGSWQEYQIEKPAMPNFSGGSSTAAPPAAPPQAAAPPPPPPAATPPASTAWTPPTAEPTEPDDRPPG